MATFYKRTGKRDTRYTARVRLAGRHVTKTFGTLGAAEVWVRRQEAAIEPGEFHAAKPGTGPLFADVVDALLLHRGKIKRPPGKTFNHALARLKAEHGLEHLTDLTVAFWRKHALDRISKGAAGSTVAGDLAYATSVLRHAQREGHKVDATAPSVARAMLREDGVRVISRVRTRRNTDVEIAAMLQWIDDNAERTSLPMRDLVEFALATGMRRGEITALEWGDVEGRVARIKRKHPTERDRIEDVPLLKANFAWPRTDPVEIIKRQPKVGPRSFRTRATPSRSGSRVRLRAPACRASCFTSCVMSACRGSRRTASSIRCASRWWAGTATCATSSGTRSSTRWRLRGNKQKPSPLNPHIGLGLLARVR